MPLIIPANSLTGGYEIDNSLRFDDGSSDSLSRTPASAGNRTTWTWSGWVKRSAIEITGGQLTLFGASSNSNNFDHFGFKPSDAGTLPYSISFIQKIGGSNVGIESTLQIFRDPSAWYHIVFAYDSTQAVAVDRIRCYVNGVLQTFNQNNTVEQDRESIVNSATTHEIGYSSGASTNYFDGYMSEVVFIDGQALDPTSFGEFDDSGIWKPIDVSGLTFGTNGFYLDFENSGSLGADVSGNGNNWTVNNLTSIDQMIDTPTNNYCTFNALANSGLDLSQGNLRFDSGVENRDTCICTFGVNQGKWYWEVFADKNTMIVGIEKDDYYPSPDSRTGQDSTGIGFRLDLGDIFVNGSTYNASYSSAIAADSVVGVALNMDDGEITFYDENSSLGVAYSSISGTYLPSGSDSNNGNTAEAVFNFGQDSSFAGNKTRQNNQDDNGQGDFYYSPPSGFYALNTKNLAEFG